MRSVDAFMVGDERDKRDIVPAVPTVPKGGQKGHTSIDVSRLSPRTREAQSLDLLLLAGRLREGDDLEASARLVIADLLDDVARRSHPRGKIALRRDILRRIKNVFYVHLDPTPAAKDISLKWCAWIPTRIPPQPGTIEYYLERLHREGIRPLRYRAILDDLHATQR